jgi:hypothetical protein
MTILSIVWFLGACKKNNDDDIPAGKKYPLENLQAKLTNQTLSSGSNENSVIVYYEIKNVSGVDYVRLAYDYNYHIRLKITLTATDGTKYEETPLVEDLASGKTHPDSWDINYSLGKTIDLTKTKLEFIYKR